MQQARVSARWRTAAILAVGIAVGSALSAAPVAGHVGGTVTHLWTQHIRPKTDQRYYTKAQATDRFVDLTDAAAGDLTGTYAAPTIAANAVGTTEVEDHTLRRQDVIRLDAHVSVDLGPVAANSCIQSSIAVPGMSASGGAEGWLFPSPNFFSLPLTVNTYTSLNDAAILRFSVCNVGASTVDPPEGSWHYLVVG